MSGPVASADSRIPISVLTGFLGSGKTTLLRHLLGSPGMDATAVLINEIGEIGLDHLLIERVDESVALLSNGCICCSIRDDLKAALRGLLGRRDRGEIPRLDRVVIETTGLADPGPILYTLAGEPVVRHHFRLAGVIATADALNAALHFSRNPEGVKQVAAADRIVVTKSDLVDAAQVDAVHAAIGRINASAEIVTAVGGRVDPEALLAEHSLGRPRYRATGVSPAAAGFLGELQRHTGDVSSLSLALDQPLDWSAFGVWLSMLLNRHGENVLRVKGILRVQGMAAPVFINAVQHIVHPPEHMQAWPTADHRSRIVFITRGIDHALLGRSLAAFTRTAVCADSLV